MSNTALTYRMPSGVPGSISRSVASATVQPQILSSSNQPTAYGVPVALDSSGNVRAVIAGDTAASVIGINVRPFPTTGNGTDGLGVSTPQTSGVVDVLKRGFINVKLNSGTAANNSAVYVRVAAPSGAKVIGGIEAAADSTNTIQLTNAFFTGAADADGNAEIAYNL